MLFLILVGFLALLFALQTTWLDLFSFAGVTPDLALVFVVYCGIHLQRNAGMGMGMAVGFLQDCLSGDLLGINTLSKGLTGFFFCTLKDKILVQGIVPISFFLIVASLFDGFIFYMVHSILLEGEVIANFWFPNIFIYVIYNAVAGLVLFSVFDVFKKWIMKKIPNQVLRPTL